MNTRIGGTDGPVLADAFLVKVYCRHFTKYTFSSRDDADASVQQTCFFVS